jgi:hypothetical protein
MSEQGHLVYARLMNLPSCFTACEVAVKWTKLFLKAEFFNEGTATDRSAMAAG